MKNTIKMRHGAKVVNVPENQAWRYTKMGYTRENTAPSPGDVPPSTAGKKKTPDIKADGS